MKKKVKTRGRKRKNAIIRNRRERGILEGTLMPKKRERTIKSPEDWERVLASVFRRVSTGKLLPEDGTKLAYIAKVASDLATLREQREQIADLKAQLAALTGVDPALLPSPDDDSEPLLITKEK